MSGPQFGEQPKTMGGVDLVSRPRDPEPGEARHPDPSVSLVCPRCGSMLVWRHSASGRAACARCRHRLVVFVDLAGGPHAESETPEMLDRLICEWVAVPDDDELENQSNVQTMGSPRKGEPPYEAQSDAA